MVIGLVEGKLATGNPCFLPTKTIKYRAGWWFGTSILWFSIYIYSLVSGQWIIILVGALEHFFYILGSSSSQLTHIFQRGRWLNHQIWSFSKRPEDLYGLPQVQVSRGGQNRNGLWKVGFIWLIHVNTLQMAILYHGIYGFMGKNDDKHCMNHGIFGGAIGDIPQDFLFSQNYIVRQTQKPTVRFGSSKVNVGCQFCWMKLMRWDAFSWWCGRTIVWGLEPF